MKKVIVIVGPTGVGKTKLSIELAKSMETEIINADSTQVYKQLNIGTAKITNVEMQGIKHHLIDIVNLSENYSVYDFQKDARTKINEIILKKKTPIIVGGTGLYLKAALYDYQFPKEDEKVKVETYDDLDNLQVHDLLKNLDSKRAEKIHPNNRVRVIRTIHRLKNFGIEEIQPLPLYEVIFIGLTTDKKTLYENINKRVDEMIQNGLLDEIKQLHEKYNQEKYYSLQAISYKELFAYLDNELSLEEAIELIKKRTRNYAKRQYTWFNNQFDVNWFNVNFDNFDLTIKEITKYLQTKD